MTPVRLVLIDDDVQVLSALTRLLRQGLAVAPNALSIEAFADPHLALRKLQERAVDLVICDYRMPRLDGVALLSQLARSHPDTVRILLTGSPDLQAVLRAVNHAGVARVLLKPWDNAELLAVVRKGLAERCELLEQRRLADTARQATGELSPQDIERRRLEALWPGITQVEWTDDGAVQCSDSGLIPHDVPTHRHEH